MMYDRPQHLLPKTTIGSFVAALFLGMATIVSLACEGTNPLGDGARQGSLSVSTQTTGSNLDANGYLLTVSGPELQSTPDIGVNDTVSYPLIVVGDYTVSLSSVAPNCSAVENPQIVRIRQQALSRVLFEVSCQ